MECIIPTVVLAMLLLAACDGGAVETRSSEIAYPAAESAAVAMKPGLWRVTAETADGPGDPREVCFKAGQDLKTMLASEVGSTENCHAERERIRAGIVDMAFTCTKDGTSMQMAITGRYDARSFDNRVEMKLDLGNGPVSTIAVATHGQHVADACSAASLADEADR